MWRHWRELLVVELKNRRGHLIPVVQLVCHDGKLPAHFDAPSVALLWNQLCLKTSLWTECRPTLNTEFKREFLLRYQWNVFQLLLVSVQSCVHSYLRIPWISLISFGYIEVDFIVGGWISWISLFRQTLDVVQQTDENSIHTVERKSVAIFCLPHCMTYPIHANINQSERGQAWIYLHSI